MPADFLRDMTIPNDDLQEIEHLRDLNLNLQAYEITKPHGKFTEWEGTEAILTASHLAYNLGAPEESWRLSSRAWHRDKTHPRAIFYFAIETFQRRGPLPALIFTRRFPDYRADETLTAWWFSLLGQIHSTLRDFSQAERWHKEAIAASPQEPWVWTAKAFSLEEEDRYEDALVAAQKGLELGPHRRASISAVANFLTLMERDEEALEILTAAAARAENAWLEKQLADLQSELGLHSEAYATLQKCFTLLPLLENKVAEWLYGGLSDGAYLIGDLEKA